MAVSKIKEIEDNIFQIIVDEVVTPDVSLFLVKGDDRNLIIDTGSAESYIAAKQCKSAIDSLVSYSQKGWQFTDVYVTHFHPDHIGLIDYCYTQGAQILFPQNFNSKIKEMAFGDFSYYFGTDESLEFLNYANMKMWLPTPEVISHRGKARYLDGSCISYGKYIFQIVHLPGHANEQFGLIDNKAGIAFIADQVIAKMTPIVPFSLTGDCSLNCYLDSVKKLISLVDIETFIPAHNTILYRNDGSFENAVINIFNYYKKTIINILQSVPSGDWVTVLDLVCRSKNITIKDIFSEPISKKWMLLPKYAGIAEFLLNVNIFECLVRNNKLHYRLRSRDITQMKNYVEEIFNLN